MAEEKFVAEEVEEVGKVEENGSPPREAERAAATRGSRAVGEGLRAGSVAGCAAEEELAGWEEEKSAAALAVEAAKGGWVALKPAGAAPWGVTLLQG